MVEVRCSSSGHRPTTAQPVMSGVEIDIPIQCDPGHPGPHLNTKNYPGKRPKQCGESKRIMYYDVDDDDDDKDDGDDNDDNDVDGDDDVDDDNVGDLGDDDDDDDDDNDNDDGYDNDS